MWPVFVFYEFGEYLAPTIVIAAPLCALAVIIAFICDLRDPNQDKWDKWRRK